MSKSHQHINRQIAKGSVWMVLFKLLEKSISIVSTVILARLLEPDDFGLVAIALLVVTLLELLRAFNFDMALIQNQEATSEHYNTAWTFNIIATTLIAILLITLAPLASSFYEDDRLLNIFLVLSFGVFVSGFENIGVVVFRKELTFHKEFAFLLGKKLIGFIIGISLALYLRNYWALVGGTVATHIGIVILSYYIQEYRPKFSLSKAKELFGFSGWLFINNMLNFLNYKMPEAVIGKFAGTSALGVFSVSVNIAKLSSTEVVLPINRAAFPGYSKLSHDYEALKKSFLNTLGMIALIVIPASMGIAAITPVMVPVLLGEKWLDAIPILQLLAIGGMISSIANTQAIYMSIGKPKIITLIFAIRLVIAIPVFIYCIYEYGLLTGVASLIVTAIIMLPIAFSYIFKELQIHFYDLLKRVFRPIVAATLMFGTIHFTIGSLLNESQPYTGFDLLGLIALGGIVYIGVTLFLWAISGRPDSSESHILTTVKDQYQKRFLRA